MKRRSIGMIGVLSLLCVVLSAGPALAYGPLAPALGSTVSVVGVGGTLPLSWSGFQPLEFVSNVAHSNPVDLPTVQADAKGEVTEQVTLPDTLGPGAHEIVATGLTSGEVATYDFTIVSSAVPAANSAVPAAAVPSGLPSGSSTSSGGGILAYTGTNAVLLTGLGAGALGVGGFLILVSRRRRSHLPI